MRAFMITFIVIAAFCCVDAARFPSEQLAIGRDAWNPIPTNWQKWTNWHKHQGHKHAYVAFRYLVEPDDRQDFEEAWLKLEESTAEEKGNMIFDLKKPLSNNVEYIAYGEWEDISAAKEHYESEYVEDFLDRLAELDVTYTMEPLIKPRDVDELTPSRGQEEEGQQAHVIVHYHVPPSAHEEFEDAWNKAAEATEDEEGSHIYSLRKVFNNNYGYYAYGTWDSMEDFHEHFASDHIHELRRTLDKHGITWHLTPLKKIGHQPE